MEYIVWLGLGAIVAILFAYAIFSTFSGKYGEWYGSIEEKNRTFVPARYSGINDHYSITLFIRSDSGKLITFEFVEGELDRNLDRLREGDRVFKKRGEHYPKKVKSNA